MSRTLSWREPTPERQGTATVPQPSGQHDEPSSTHIGSARAWTRRRAAAPTPAAAGDLERIVGSIGLKVFSLRKRMGLSLQQLGERSDVSAAAIHKIEQGGMVPTITTLLKIAGALGRPVSYFVEEDIGQDDVAVLTPPDENRPVYTSHQGIDLSSISGPYGRFLLAGARATVAPGATSGRKPMQHPGRGARPCHQRGARVHRDRAVIPGESRGARCTSGATSRTPGTTPARPMRTRSGWR